MLVAQATKVKKFRFNDNVRTKHAKMIVPKNRFSAITIFFVFIYRILSIFTIYVNIYEDVNK